MKPKWCGSVQAIVYIISLSLTFLLFVAGVSQAQECRVVRIHGISAHDTVKVEPGTAWVSKGACVIWFNRSTANEVKVVFKEGKKCASISDAPVGFSLDHEQCYVTSWIPFGGTSSLRFLQPGTYEYEIYIAAGPEGTKGSKVDEGKIIVQ